MLSFDSNGNPQPPGLLPMNFMDFEDVFVSNYPHSVTRASIFQGYKAYIADMQAQITPQFNQWVNGSFTTTKVDPNDIDIVNVIDVATIAASSVFPFTTKGGSKANYDVDGYYIPVYHVSDPRYSLTKQSVEYWLKWFGTDRSGNPKALIELSIV